jgi:uncharacterized protein (TIGR03435 family)
MVNHIRSAVSKTAIIVMVCIPQIASSQDASKAAAPQFEVASVKQVIRNGEPERPNRSKGDTSFVGKSGNLFKVSGRRVEIQGTALALIAAAYDAQPYQIQNAPAWADSAIYAVTAEIGGDSDAAQGDLRLMMQSLLAERFQLALHRETRQVNVYYLMPAKGKTGLKQADESEPFTWKLYRGEADTLRSKATHESIADFVQLVGVSADRPVINRTGITGYIDYDILINMNGQDPRDPDSINRAILDAVKDQLALKLQPAKDGIEFLVVDRIVKPSEN